MLLSSHVPKIFFQDGNYRGTRLVHFFEYHFLKQSRRTKFDECQDGERNRLRAGFTN